MEPRPSYTRRGSGRRDVSDSHDDDLPELSHAEIRSLRALTRFMGHIAWLWRTILRPVVITVCATLVALPGLIAALKELLKIFGGSGK